MIKLPVVKTERMVCRLSRHYDTTGVLLAHFLQVIAFLTDFSVEVWLIFQQSMGDFLMTLTRKNVRFLSVLLLNLFSFRHFTF